MNKRESQASYSSISEFLTSFIQMKCLIIIYIVPTLINPPLQATFLCCNVSIINIDHNNLGRDFFMQRITEHYYRLKSRIIWILFIKYHNNFSMSSGRNEEVTLIFLFYVLRNWGQYWQLTEISYKGIIFAVWEMIRMSMKASFSYSSVEYILFSRRSAFTHRQSNRNHIKH